MYGAWDYLKNVGQKCANYELIWAAYITGPRELFAAGVPGVSMMMYDFYIPTKIEDIREVSEKTTLWNYPNPFQSKTTVWYEVSMPGNVRLSLIDTRGREITTLFDEHRNAGIYNVEFIKGDLPAGIYFCRMIQGNHSVINRIVVLE